MPSRYRMGLFDPRFRINVKCWFSWIDAHGENIHLDKISSTLPIDTVLNNLPDLAD